MRKFLMLSVITLLSLPANLAQSAKQRVRVVTIPITIISKKELKKKNIEEVPEVGEISVKENGEEQTIISIRSVSESPLSLAILIQEDLSSLVNLELKSLGDFIKRLPKGSRVMVAYIRGGSVIIRQRFTEDLDKAAKSLTVVSPNLLPTANSIFQSVEDVTKRFDALPSGRRAMLLISDGLDASIISSTSLQSVDLDRAVTKAQQRSVAIYSFYAAGGLVDRLDRQQVLAGQSLLLRLCEETGGRAFFSGFSTPVSFKPFFQELAFTLERQFVLSYISTNMKKGYYKIEVTSTNPEVKIEHPSGYYYKK